MSKLNGKASEVLDACLSLESPEVKAKVYQIINLSGLEPDDPMFLILALTGQMRVFLETAPAELSKLLKEWKECNSRSLEQIYQAISLIEEQQQQQANTIKQNLEVVSSQWVSQIKEAGMAATSAIADANSETLAQARQVCQRANELKEDVDKLRNDLKEDRQYNADLLKVLANRTRDETLLIEKVRDEINSSYTILTRLKKEALWSRYFDWLAPLLALLLVASIFYGVSTWFSSIMYNVTINSYERQIIKWNRERLQKCNRDNNPKCTLWIVPPEKRK